MRRSAQGDVVEAGAIPHCGQAHGRRDFASAKNRISYWCTGHAVGDGVGVIVVKCQVDYKRVSDLRFSGDRKQAERQAPQHGEPRPSRVRTVR